MSKRDTHRALTALFKSAMGGRGLPRSMETSIRLMTGMGLPSSIFQFIPPLRRIVISELMEETPYLGAYFATRLYPTPGTEGTDWNALGWDNEPHMMLFPHIPPEWVFLHETGHYFDDTFILAVREYNDRDSASETIMDTLDRKRLDEFCDRHYAMEREFNRAQEVARGMVETLHGGIAALSNKWYWKIPRAIVSQNGPSDYAFVNLPEWTAESFQSLCVWRDISALEYTAPKTTAFMQFFFSGKIFKKMSREVSCAQYTSFALSEASAKG